jgi:hypothetical protein
MIPQLRSDFNRAFTDGKYRALLYRLERRCGTPVPFRVCETPLFLPGSVMRRIEVAAREILGQLMSNHSYMAESMRAVPEKFRVPGDSPHPLFVALDFGLVQDAGGEFVPRLIELQGFPSLYAYQVVLMEEYRNVYGLPSELHMFLGGLDTDAYYDVLRRAVLGGMNPENVILLEIDPLQQKTLPDFLLTEKVCGIASVNIRDLVRRGTRLFYDRGHRQIPVHRIYNRIIVEDLVRSGATLPFDFRDQLDVEWAGHPNWFFRLSKFSLPYLQHPASPASHFLADVNPLPANLEAWVLKPLFSFAGAGVRVSPSREEIDRIPATERRNFILQEKVNYGTLIQTPEGGTKAEIRVMYIWLEQPVPVLTLVRMGRGTMMGVDHNRNMGWVGSSASFVQE